MEQQLPVTLQAALYVASIASVVSVMALLGMLFQFRKQLERLVGTVEELKVEIKPLVQEMRVAVRNFRDLSGRAKEQWTEVEEIIDTARSWTARANHLVDEIGSVVETPIFAVTHRIRALRKGLAMFVQVLLTRNQFHQQKGRKS